MHESLSCAICGDELGNLCEKCSPAFDSQIELLALNAHGIAHAAQISEILKAQNEELISKRLAVSSPRFQAMSEIESLTRAKLTLEAEEQKRTLVFHYLSTVSYLLIYVR